jgi:hypothetical protein
MLANLCEERRFIYVAIVSIERDEFDNIGQASPEFPQDRIDVPDHDLGLSGEIISV